MKAAAPLLAALALAPACATSWVGVQAAGIQPMLDENVREVSVPEPGLVEHLRVWLPPPSAGGEPSLRCAVEQAGTDAVYHAAYRYGRSWKWATAVMFFVEAGAATALMLASEEQPPKVVGGLLAADALGTAALFFAPRKEIYRRDVRPHAAAVRGDCPVGLTLSIDGAPYEVDVDGRIGELGLAALDAWMAGGAGGLQAEFGGQARDLVVMAGDRCGWTQTRTGTPVPGCVVQPATDASQFPTARLPVAVGTLSAAPSAAPDAAPDAAP